MAMIIFIDPQASRYDFQVNQLQVWWKAISIESSVRREFNGFTEETLPAGETPTQTNNRIEQDIRAKHEVEFGVVVTNPVRLFGGRTS